MGLKLQTFAYFVYIPSCAVSFCLGRWYGAFFNVDSVNTDVMNSSKRQTTPWTKSTKKPGPKKKEKGEYFDESKKRNSPPVTKVPDLTSLQAIFQEFREFHTLQLPEKLVPVA